MLKNFSLAIKFLWREWRGGEWLIVFAALVLAIAATTAMHFYTDRLTRGLDEQSIKFLGGDLAIDSSTPIPSAWKERALAKKLRIAEVWSYPSVVSAKSQLQLVNLQAVSENYPLVGPVSKRPAEKKVWVETRLLPLLNVQLNDYLTIGKQDFQLENMLLGDIDSLNTGWIIAPRAMIRLEDVALTKTVLPGSQINYRLLLVGEKIALHNFRNWVEPQLNSSQRIIDVKSQQFILRNVLDKAQNYLQLALLICLMMSAVAIIMSTQQYLRRHYLHVAIWRCLGARQRQIMGIFIWQLLIIGLIAGMIAVTLGFVAQLIFVNLFKNYLQFSLPTSGFSPVLLGLGTSLFLLFAFAYPVINELPRTPPLYIWRNERAQNTWGSQLYFVGVITAIIVFVCWFMEFSSLTLTFIDLLLISFGILYLLSWALLRGVKLLLPRTDGAIRRGLSQLLQYAKSVTLQFIGFNLIIILLLTLGLVRSHIVENWQEILSKDTPNYFAINIAPTDLKAVEQFFKDQKIFVEWIYPMARGRLTALNNTPILAAVPAAMRGHNALHRELNLSWMWKFPSDNKLVQGKRWEKNDAGQPLVSVERTLAEDLHLRMGDELTFQMGEKTFNAKISSIRIVDWASFHPNFFMIFPPGFINDFATTYITSFHLSPDQTIVLNALIQAFPNMTIIDMAGLLQQIQELVSKITLAMQYLFIFALGAGILIFVTSLQSSMDERMQTYHLLRVLGAGKKYIRKSLVVEFSCLAILILGSATTLAFLIVYVLERSIFVF